MLEHPPIMYHGTSHENRQSILEHGLLRSKGEAAQMGGYGGIFLSSKYTPQGGGIDEWEVDVRGLDLEEDDTTIPEDEEDTWWVTYDVDIPPERLKLMSKEKQASSKFSYISPPQGVLELNVIRDSNPRVTLNLDLGIPNFTVFSMTLPLVENEPKAMSELLAEAIHVLCDEVANFMLVMDYQQEVIVQTYSTVLNCYKGMSRETDTDKTTGELTEDDFIKTYAGTFNLPQSFVNETQNRVVTAGKTIKRPPKYRKIDLSVEKPPKATTSDVARVIRQYRGRSLKTQPKPLFVVVYDQVGRPSGTLPLGPQFKNKLLNLVKKQGSAEFTNAVTLDNEHEMRYLAVDGIPGTITIDGRIYRPSATAGKDTALYSGDTGDWLVKLMDGRIVGPFPGRPNIASLRYLNYPIPKNRYRWHLLSEGDIPDPEPEEPEESDENAVLEPEGGQDENAGKITL